MTDVEFNTKELKRVMEWYSWKGKKEKQLQLDIDLFKKIEVMYKAEKEYEADVAASDD